MAERADDIAESCSPENERWIRRWCWWSKARRAWTRPGSVLVGLVVLAYGIANILKGVDTPSEDFWTAGEPGAVLLIVFGSAATLGYFGVVTGYGRLLKRRDTEFELYRLARSISRFLVKELRIDGDNIGVHIWRVVGWRRAEHLQLVTAFFWERKIAPSITWRKDKGVLGKCWRDETEQVVDVAWEHEIKTKRDWDAQPAEKRNCLTWSEVHRTRHFHAIWAMPLFSPTGCGNRFQGCISVDIAESGKCDDMTKLVHSKPSELEALIASCQLVLSGEVGAEPR